MTFDNYECEGQLSITEYLQTQISKGSVKDLTEWINSNGKAQYSQIEDLLTESLARYGIPADAEQIDRLTNSVSVWVLEQSMGYMQYLRGENGL